MRVAVAAEERRLYVFRSEAGELASIRGTNSHGGGICPQGGAEAVPALWATSLLAADLDTIGLPRPGTGQSLERIEAGLLG